MGRGAAAVRRPARRLLRHRERTGPGSGLARFGLAATAQAAAAITALQAVDGIALKWAVDNWTAAPVGEKTAAFAAAEALRWTEYAFQSYSNILIGLALALYGLAIARGYPLPALARLGRDRLRRGMDHPRCDGRLRRPVRLHPRLVGMALLAVFAVGIAPRMWRANRHQTAAEQRDLTTAS